jgi:hypothetical protein
MLLFAPGHRSSNHLHFEMNLLIRMRQYVRVWSICQSVYVERSFTMDVEPLLDAIRTQIQPEGRVQHLTGMIEELLPRLNEDVTLADVIAGWQLLSHPQGQQEPSSVAHRRGVYAELAATLTPWAREPGRLPAAVKAWKLWQEACQSSADPRLAAMAKTLARELVELQSADEPMQ